MSSSRTCWTGPARSASSAATRASSSSVRPASRTAIVAVRRILDDRPGQAGVGDRVAGVRRRDQGLGGRVLHEPPAGELDAEGQPAHADPGEGDQRPPTPDRASQSRAAAHQVGVALRQPAAHPAEVARCPSSRGRARTAGPGDRRRRTSARVTTSAETIEASTPIAQRDAEAADRPGGEEEQQTRGEQGGDVGVGDRRPGLAEAGGDGGAHAAGRGCAAYSSRARSKTSTLASTAMPIASTKPARPGRVRVAPSASSAA